METIAKTYQLIDRAALKAKIDGNEEFHLWNVLNAVFFEADANIPGSRWVPFESLTKENAAANAALGDVIVVYCEGGLSTVSQKAGETLSALGYNNVFVYQGGLKDWIEAGYPLATVYKEERLQ